jgi:hypothetical protein
MQREADSTLLLIAVFVGSFAVMLLDTELKMTSWFLLGIACTFLLYVLVAAAGEPLN